MHDVVLEFFAMKAPDPHHWTLNSCFGALLSVWVHLDPFHYYTKLATKHAKLVQLIQKFVPRCLVRIFRNEHSRSIPLESKLMFWCVSFHLGALEPFRYCTKLAAKRTKLVQLMQKFVPRGLVSNFYNERPRSIPLDPKLMFWCVSFCSGAFWNSFATA